MGRLRPVARYRHRQYLPRLRRLCSSAFFPRTSALLLRIKASANYDEPIGQAFGVIGTDVTMDPGSMQPRIKVRLGTGGRPEILWQKNGMDAIDIYVDRQQRQFCVPRHWIRCRITWTLRTYLRTA
jgi:hypothetical protein